jgi:diaminopimelate decarboxylase
MTDMVKTLALALERGMIGSEDTAAVLYDLTFLRSRALDLKHTFPPETTHTFALKAIPLPSVLHFFRSWGFGVEAASLPELYIAERCGFSPAAIVFDSPVKTVGELEHALALGCHINVDSFPELERIDRLLRNRPPGCTIGLRINPQVGEGTIAMTSVATQLSKFGVPLRDERDRLHEAFLRYPWLTGVHVHVGSQAYPVERMVQAAREVVAFVRSTNEALREAAPHRRIEVVDLGGGFPVSYMPEVAGPDMKQYVTRLFEETPDLFSGEFRVITEFGRYLTANAGWAATRVEYVKHSSSGNVLLTHLGADMFLRRCYNPAVWHLEFTLVDRSGRVKSGGRKRYMLAGPLCFAGDVLAREIELPEAESGDYVIIHDAGAYTLGMWSRYNSRQMPKIIGYEAETESFEVLKERETPEDVYRFWDPR